MVSKLNASDKILRIIAIALAVILAVPMAGFISCAQKETEPVYGKGVSFVAVDINPSVELILDNENRVASVYAANEDAEIMLYDANGIIGEPIAKAAVNLANLAETYGYIKESGSVVSAVAVAESEAISQGIFAAFKNAFESGCESVKVNVVQNVDAVLGAKLKKLKAEYPANADIQRLDIAQYRLICSAMASDTSLTVTDAAKMSTAQLVEIVENNRAKKKNILSRAMATTVSAAELVCEQTKSNLKNTVYIKYGGLEAVKYIALDNAYFAIMSLCRAKRNLAEFGITEESAREVALKLGIPMERVDEFVADCKNSEGYITDETLSFAVNKWYRNADASLKTKMDEYMPEFTEKLNEFSVQIDRVSSPVVDSVKSALDTLKNATGIDLGFAFRTYEELSLLALELKTKAEASERKIIESLTEEEKIQLEADIAKLDGRIQGAERTFESTVEKAKNEAEKALKKAQEQRK